MDKVKMKHAINRYMAAVCAAGLLFCSAAAAAAELPDVDGFFELGAGARTKDGAVRHDDYNYLEQRVQLRKTFFAEGDNFFSDRMTSVEVKADFTADQYWADSYGELRSLNAAMTPFAFMDVKVGRQVLTWGTGDYLFINDMFPKDYVSFYIGREDEYLKKPSDAAKVSFYSDAANLDVVVIPFFEPNTMPDGPRLSFYDPFLGRIAGDDTRRGFDYPDTTFSNTELALRLYRTFESTQAALYYFHGFDKMPRYLSDPLGMEMSYEKVDVFGASLLGPVWDGIGNVEAGYQRSRQDEDGTDPFIENSMFKIMAGYSRDMGSDLRLGFQYQLEQRLDYGAYEDSLPAGSPVFDEFRHLLTNRITKQLLDQTLTLSLFTFYSPSDGDGYSRPSASYDITDRWKTTLGANLPWGREDYTEFGQMRDNTNVYLRMRYSF